MRDRKHSKQQSSDEDGIQNMKDSQLIRIRARSWMIQVLCLLAVPLTWPLSLSADQAQYFYDELGRLTGVLDEQGQGATYQYDQVGNLLAIVPGAVAPPMITSVAPDPIEAGSAAVTLTGSGLLFGTVTTSSPDIHASHPLSNDENLLTVTITSPNPPVLTATTVTVTGPLGTATAPLNFVQPMPTISELVPSAGQAGATIVIRGTGFGTQPGSNVVTFSGSGGIRLPAVVVSESFTSLVVEVPVGVTEGLVMVQVGSLISLGITFFPSGLTGSLSEAATGTPAQSGVPSANIGQTILLQGHGLIEGRKVDIPTRTANGVVGTAQVRLTNVSIDGRTTSVVVPPLATTGQWRLTGSTVPGVQIQIVPTVTLILGEVVVGRPILVHGSGYHAGTTDILFSERAGDVFTGNISGSNDLITLPLPDGITGGNLSVQTTGGTSAPIPVPIGLDAVSPEIVDFSSNWFDDLPTNAPIRWQFIEPMNPATLVLNNLRVEFYEPITFTPIPVEGTLQISPDHTVVSFFPNAPWRAETFYDTEWSTAVTDANGNPLTGFRDWGFDTRESDDLVAPQFVQASPPLNAVEVPLNVDLYLGFTERVDHFTIQEIRVLANGEEQAGTFFPSFMIDDGGNIVWSSDQLLPNTTYTVEVPTTVTDFAEQALTAPGSTTFTTGSDEDTTPPTVLVRDPAPGATDISLTYPIQVRMSEPVNHLLFGTNSALFLEQPVPSSPDGFGARLDATVTLSADGQLVTLLPSAPLVADTTYQVVLNTGRLLDWSGNRPSFRDTLKEWTFTTSTAVDSTAPAIVAVNPPDGSIDVPVNTRVSFQFTEQLPLSVVNPTTLQVSSTGGPIMGTVVINEDNTVLTFVPDMPYPPSTELTATVVGVTDRAGNVMPAFSSTLTTGVSTATDTTAPTLVSVVPTQGATDIDVGTTIELTYSEPVDPITVNEESLPVTSAMFGTPIPGAYAVNGAVVTFTPQVPLFPGVRITTTLNNQGVNDYAGNGHLGVTSRHFTTAGSAPGELIPPEILQIVPSAGAIDVSVTTPIVLCFSEPINANTLILGETVGLLEDGLSKSFTMLLSADHTMLTITPTFRLDWEALITVQLTQGVQDLAGNSLPAFSSQFTTIDRGFLSLPRLVSLRPSAGATEVSPDTDIIYFTDSPVDETTLPGSIEVLQDGVEIPGISTLEGSGQVIRHVPTNPLGSGMFVRVTGNPDFQLKDVAGGRFNRLSGFFTTKNDPTLSPPSVVRMSPEPASLAVPLNAQIEVELSEAVNVGTVTPATVSIREAFIGSSPLPATITLEGSGTVIRLVPTQTLAPHTNYVVDLLPGIQDVHGDPLGQPVMFGFSTGTMSDIGVPQVTVASILDGAEGVGLNANIGVIFDEAINPLSITPTTLQLTEGTQTFFPCSLAFSPDNQRVSVMPHEPLPPNTLMTLHVAGVYDLAGNLVVPYTTQFTTGALPDTTQPTGQLTPPHQATNVPINAVIAVQTDEALDPLTVNTETFQVIDTTTGLPLPGTVALDATRRLVTFVPEAALANGQTYRMTRLGESLRDVAGNSTALGVFTSTFTTGMDPDVVAPQVNRVSPFDGMSQVPLNATVGVGFSEPIQTASLDQITVTSAQGEVPIEPTMTTSNQTVLLRPLAPLAPSTLYTVTVGDILDLSGNVAPRVTTTFTTGTEIDLVNPTVTALNVPHQATGVSTTVALTADFSEPMHPFLDSDRQFIGFNVRLDAFLPSSVQVEGTVVWSPDGQQVTFTPDVPLAPGTLHRFLVQIVTDLGGNRVANFSSTFTTAP